MKLLNRDSNKTKYGWFRKFVYIFKYNILYRLLFISSMCKSNCDRVPTNDFIQVFGDERLSLDEDMLIGLSRPNDIERFTIGLSSGLGTVFTLLCTVTLFTLVIFPFFRPSFMYTSRSSSTSSKVPSPDPSIDPPAPPIAA